MLHSEEVHMNEENRTHSERIRFNKTLPFLVVHVIEGLSLPSHNDRSDNIVRKFGPILTVFLLITSLIAASQLLAPKMTNLYQDSGLEWTIIIETT
jgi:hypothetical protein